jgi:hypothetical protein
MKLDILTISVSMEEWSMPEARVWTAAADGVICTMREAGDTWATIGSVLGLSRNTVIERGRRLRAYAPTRVVLVAEKQVSEDPNRLPLPAGHPPTWRLISDAPYPE